ncbi:winged helix-turn-helix domain-containing protein [Chloroflexota bacterium]
MNNNDHIENFLKEEGLSSKHEVDVKHALLMRHESLGKELQELDSVISKLQEEYTSKLEELNIKKKPLEEALHHVEALLHFEGCYLDSNTVGTMINATVTPDIKLSATDAAFQLLTEIHQPLHYKEIALKLQERNLYIPGKDPAATLLSRINRDSRFKRAKKRGTYAISSWRLRDTKKKRRKIQKVRKR